MEQDKWVSVADKLPKVKSATCNVSVLIHTSQGDIKVCEFGRYYRSWGVASSDDWFFRNGSNHYSKKSVTHWQPLPSPPNQQP